jgi:hypothetical protein
MDIKLVVGIINTLTKEEEGNQHVTVLATDTLKVVTFSQYRENIKIKTTKKDLHQMPHKFSKPLGSYSATQGFI